MAQVAGSLGRLEPRRGHRSLLLAVVVLALAGGGVGSWLAARGSSGAATSAAVAVADRGTISVTVSGSGPVTVAGGGSAAKTSGGTAAAGGVGVQVYPQTSGQLLSLFVHPGQLVRAGQALGRLDATAARRALRQAQASLASARAQYEVTVAGETAAQRAQDALSVTQARQSLRPAQQAVTSAKSALERARRSAALDVQKAHAALAQARRQLGIDQGQLKVDLAQRATDQVPYKTAAEALAAVNAAQAQLATDLATQQQHSLNGNAQTRADQAQLAADQARQYADEQLQTADQHQLNVDKAAQSAAADGSVAKSNATAAVNADNDNLDSLTARLQVDAHNVTLDQTKLSNDQSAMTTTDTYTTSQDQSKLSTDQGSLSALQADQKTIRSDELTIFKDRQAIAGAEQSVRTTALQGSQSLAAARQQVVGAGQQVAAGQLSLRQTIAANRVKQAPPAPAQVASARAGVVQAEVTLAAARLTLAQTVLRAPAAGTVTGDLVTPGTPVDPTVAVATVGDLRRLSVTINMSEFDVASVKVGDRATVNVAALGGTAIPATVSSVAPVGVNNSGVVQFPVTVTLTHRPPLLRPGMLASVQVTTAERRGVVRIPLDAVGTIAGGDNAGQTYVSVVDRGGHPRRRFVDLGLAGPSRVEVLHGVKAGDRLLIQVAAASSPGGIPGAPASNSPPGIGVQPGGGDQGGGNQQGGQ